MTYTGEKASDTAPGDTHKAGIQSKEKVDAQTDIPTTGAKVKFNKNHFPKLIRNVLPSTTCHSNTRITSNEPCFSFFHETQETNKDGHAKEQQGVQTEQTKNKGKWRLKWYPVRRPKSSLHVTNTTEKTCHQHRRPTR